LFHRGPLSGLAPISPTCDVASARSLVTDDDRRRRRAPHEGLENGLFEELCKVLPIPPISTAATPHRHDIVTIDHG
jgi:hypothetical protein